MNEYRDKNFVSDLVNTFVRPTRDCTVTRCYFFSLSEGCIIANGTKATISLCIFNEVSSSLSGACISFYNCESVVSLCVAQNCEVKIREEAEYSLSPFLYSKKGTITLNQCTAIECESREFNKDHRSVIEIHSIDSLIDNLNISYCYIHWQIIFSVSNTKSDIKYLTIAENKLNHLLSYFYNYHTLSNFVIQKNIITQNQNIILKFTKGVLSNSLIESSSQQKIIGNSETTITGCCIGSNITTEGITSINPVCNQIEICHIHGGFVISEIHREQKNIIKSLKKKEGKWKILKTVTLPILLFQNKLID